MKKLYIEFSTDRDLYESFMPFLKGGGLFIRSSQVIELETEVALEVLLPDSLEKSFVKGVVCWLTPVGAQNGTPAGVGISFTDDPDKIRFQIEKAIARHLNSSDPTLTM
jgi:type IV pilus assembly protein PilZ